MPIDNIPPKPNEDYIKQKKLVLKKEEVWEMVKVLTAAQISNPTAPAVPIPDMSLAIVSLANHLYNDVQLLRE